MLNADLLLTTTGELATPRGSGSLDRASGMAMGEVLRLRAGAAIAIRDGKIVAVGTPEDLAGTVRATKTVDLGRALVLPGFVDAHTHPVFATTREMEFELRASGATYLEIAKSGGGILSTVRGVREASEEQLLARLLIMLDRFLAVGTTTLEAKSGYGLSLDDELKCLRVLRRANAEHPIELVSTFLGAHDYPEEFRDRHADYESLLVEEMLPRVAEERLAEYCDIFTESHVFDLDASRRILTRAAELGLRLRLHVDQLTPLGGAELAAELGASSADHLEFVSPAGIEALARAGTVPVLCPLVPLYLRLDQEAPARKMVDAGLAPALSTDFNPGSCNTQSLPEVCTFASLRYGFSASECLAGITLNAARSLDRGHCSGSLEVGKQADLCVLDIPNLEHLTYEFGRNPIRSVYKCGVRVFDRHLQTGEVLSP